MHREGNGAPHHRDDLEVSSIDEPEIQNNPSEAPLTAFFDENFIPPAIAHLSADGDSPQPYTETGEIQTVRPTSVQRFPNALHRSSRFDSPDASARG